MKAYIVYQDGQEIDKVFYADGDSVVAEDVYRSLVYHDGYSSHIIVAREAQDFGTPQYNEDGTIRIEIYLCETCGEQWNDAIITGITPTPSGRCPFEYEHEYDEEGE